MSRPAGSRPEPPRLARRLLERALPADVRDDVCGDLLELFEHRRAEQGPRRARLWYWREAVSFAVRFGGERLRERRPSRRQGNRSALLSSGRGGGLMRARASWLDFKLGFRMLLKYPGLTVVGGFAFAFAIFAGAGTFEFVRKVLDPSLPLPDGERVVAIENRDVLASAVEWRALADFAVWREELESIEELGALRTSARNLIAAGATAGPVDVVETSASLFRVARLKPLLGRTLVDADELPGAPPVAVIGYDVWQARFAGAADVVGREIRLGAAVHTVVGVMPEGFSFPRHEGLWVPLRLDPLRYGRREGPAVRVFGRLVPGASLEEAQAELTALGARAAAAYPDTHEHLRPRVLPYAKSIFRLGAGESAAFMSANVVAILLLVLVCGNVALLMFARAATRESEMVVRNALGASRGRLIGQLFAEALVLGGVAAAVGLAAAAFTTRLWLAVLGAEMGGLPFWMGAGLSPATVVYAALLTVLGAAVAGVVPALKVTRGLGVRLRRATAGGGGYRFGGLWTVVVVSQVAATVAFPVFAYFVRRDMLQIQSVEAGFPAAEYLSARLELDRESAASGSADSSMTAFLARYHDAALELERRLEADPAVASVTLAERLPLMYHPHRLIEVDDGGAAPRDPRWAGYRVSNAAVALDFFDVPDAPILEGRGFESGDLESDHRVVIVNQSFVERVLGGLNPIGRRLRYIYFEEWDGRRQPEEEPGPWYEIVGVVSDMGMAVPPDPKVAGIYHPLSPDAAYPVHMAVHVRGDPASFAPRLRTLALAVDPAMRLHDLMPLDQVNDYDLRFTAFWFWLVVAVSAMALLLSLAGIYAVMSFTVAQRTREIGVRIALGADAWRIAAAAFRRPLTQVGIGILAGGGLAALLSFAVLRREMGAEGVAILVAYAAAMMGICMVACIVPTRRALGIQPVEALRADG